MAGELIQKWIFDDFRAVDFLDLATNHTVENVILSTVAYAPTAEWERQMAQHFGYWQLSANTDLPIENRYATPATLGKDRLAAVVGAGGLYPGHDCLVIDAGTCMTADFISGDGIYRGGNISPGVQMRLRAMHEFTARLPEVQPDQYPDDLGNSTETALQNGGWLGAVLEIEGLQQRLRVDYPRLTTLLTGGDAELLAKRLKSKIFVHSNLVLVGLNKILEYNVERLA